MHETERRVEAMMAAIAAEYQRELSERPVNPSGPGVGVRYAIDVSEVVHPVWRCDGSVRAEAQ